MTKTFPTWDAFRFKYQGEALQRERFEDLVRALFCHRYGIKFGIYQCYNHPGNETDTITVENEVIGFTAKYFKEHIDVDQILHSIETAHSHNPSQTKILIYCNFTFGNKNGKPIAQKNVENVSAAYGMSVEWVTDKMILDQVMKIDWVYDFFFAADGVEEQIIKKESFNTKSIFATIRASIEEGKFSIKRAFDKESTQIVEIIENGQHAILYGEGGSGKTALLKDISERLITTCPICIRKAQDIKRSTMAELFPYGLDNFVRTFEDSDKKIFVIDSAERLQDLDDFDTIDVVINTLKDSGWTLIFTVRNGYVNDLNEDLQYKFRVTPKLVEIRSLTTDELTQIANDNSFELPQSQSFKERLCNLFYLSQYLRYYDSIAIGEGYNKFIEKIWKERITGASNKNGISRKREEQFKLFIEKRINEDRFYLNPESFEAEPLQGLISEEILGESEQGIYITHDIFEEWGLYRIINDRWIFKESIESFFRSLDTSLLVRREFRNWLSSTIDDKTDLLTMFVDAAKSFDIDDIWKDEILVSVLKSSHASIFLSKYKDLLLEDNAKLLNRVVFLLQLACKRLDKIVTLNGCEYPLYLPEGSGWEEVIHFLYEYKQQNITVKYWNKVLNDWTQVHKDGAATREAGLLALDAWGLTESKENLFMDKEYSSELCNIIINSAKEIKDELACLINKVVTNRWISHRDPYYDLFHHILSKPTDCINLYAAVPNEMYSLMDAFWKYQPDNHKQSDDYGYWAISDRNASFGLNLDEIGYGYGSASAIQTPVYYLLCFKPSDTIQYIIDFVNYSINQCKEESKDNNQLENVNVFSIDGTSRVQIGDYALWGLYRGACHTVFPDILQSMHMALEKALLELADDDNYTGFVKKAFDLILARSVSVSLTAIIASVVIAHPDKFWMYALSLFKTPELFHWDSIRLQDESQLNWFYGMASINDKFAADERFSTLKQQFRKKCLESLCVEMQYARLSAISDTDAQQITEQMGRIFDFHFDNAKRLPKGERDIREILLYRMDRRKHNPLVKRSEGNHVMIELNPQMPESLKRESVESCEEILRSMRFGHLNTWCSLKAEGDEKSKTYKQYEENPLSAIMDAREVVSKLQKKEPLMPMDEYAPRNVAGVMVQFYPELLKDDDLEFCQGVVEKTLGFAVRSEYWPQMSDGVERCTHALPNLIGLFPEKVEVYKDILVKLLLNKNDIGAYKRVCDYAIETIGEYANTSFTESVIELYLSCFKDGLDTESAEVLLELIPHNTNNCCLLNHIKQVIPAFADTLKKDENHSYSHMASRYDRHLFLYKSYADFVLQRHIEELQDYITPFINMIDGDEHSTFFIQALINAEDRLKNKEVFWTIWELLYPCVVANRFRYGGKLMGTYLFVGYYMADIKEWHSLDSENIWLFEKISRECADSPVVLYALAKNLNYLASRFEEEGIDWLYSVTSVHPDLNLREREPNTIFYMERFLGKYVRASRTSIKRDKEKKKKLVNVLTFMVERNSVQAYMLRDMIA